MELADVGLRVLRACGIGKTSHMLHCGEGSGAWLSMAFGEESTHFPIDTKALGNTIVQW
jgi:hypothetical protein